MEQLKRIQAQIQEFFVTTILPILARFAIWLNPILSRLALWLERVTLWLLRQLAWVAQRLWAGWQKLKALNPFTPIQLILIVFVVLGLVYAWATPIFEASDELWHFGVVYHIAETGELPVQVIDGEETPWRQEGSQPPLYYLIASAISAPFDMSDFDAVRTPNPHAVAGNAAFFGNKNLLLHDTPYPVLEGTALAVYAVRMFSLVLGVVTVYFVYRCGQLVAPDRPVVAVLAAGITAFNPMFLFIAASVNNDNLVTALNSVIIYLLLALLRHGFDTRRSVAMGVLVGLAALSKISALVLIPVLFGAAAWIYYRRRDQRGLIIFSTALVMGIVVLAGWWYVRNLQLYGELLGTTTMAQVAGPRPEDFNPLLIFSEFQGFRFGYWGVFGAYNIQATPLYYIFMDLVVLGALVSLVFTLLQQWTVREYAAERRMMVQILFLGGIVLLGVIGVMIWTSQTLASQGRLLFPLIAAASTLLAVGVSELMWWLTYLLRPLDYSVTVPDVSAMEQTSESIIHYSIQFFAIFALLIPITVIAPQYQPPTPLETLPDTIIDIDPDVQFGDVTLLAYETHTDRYIPGDYVPVTLYWRVDEQSDRDYSLFLTAFDQIDDAIGQINSYPGGGTLRTTQWEPGRIYADTYGVPLSPDTRGRFVLRLQVGWWYRPEGEYITPVVDGDEIDSVMLEMGAFIEPGTQPLPSNYVFVQDARFGGIFTLVSYRLSDDGQSLSLVWQAAGGLLGDYRVLVHVLDGDIEGLLGATAPLSTPTPVLGIVEPLPTSEATSEATAEVTPDPTVANYPVSDIVLSVPELVSPVYDFSEFVRIGGGDAAPSIPTRYWYPGDRFITRHELVFDEGDPVPGESYLIVVGWYDASDPMLPRLEINDNEYPQQVYPLLVYEYPEPRPEDEDAGVDTEAVDETDE